MDREERMRRAASTDPAVQQAYAAESRDEARRLIGLRMDAALARSIEQARRERNSRDDGLTWLGRKWLGWQWRRREGKR